MCIEGELAQPQAIARALSCLLLDDSKGQEGRRVRARAAGTGATGGCACGVGGGHPPAGRGGARTAWERAGGANGEVPPRCGTWVPGAKEGAKIVLAPLAREKDE